jgi:cellobiose phosphorylase
MRPAYNGFIIDPCIPSHWSGFRATRKFRGKVLNLEVRNEKGVQKGVEQMIVNGERLAGKCIPFDKLMQENTIVVTLG